MGKLPFCMKPVTKGALYWTLAVWLAGCVFAFGQNPAPSQGPTEKAMPGAEDAGKEHPAESRGPVDVLSDTGGTNLSGYLTQMLSKIKTRWYQQIPESAHGPTMKKGRVSIQFRIMKDGKVIGQHYTENSGDTGLDQAAYQAIADSSPLPALPGDFPCDDVAIRVHFYYNPGVGDIHEESRVPLLPCIRTSVHFIGAVEIMISPSSTRVPVGARQQFQVSMSGDAHPAVSWRVEGPGCTASLCGSISTDGVYNAPLSVPTPATVKVLATFAGSPEQTTSATITIVPRP